MFLKPMYRKIIMMCCLLLIHSGLAAETQWSSLRQLWVDALKSSNPVTGILDDDFARLIRTTTNANGVTKVKAYVTKRNPNNPKCGSVTVEVTQTGVPTSDSGATVDYPFHFMVDVCEDGCTTPVLRPVPSKG